MSRSDLPAVPAMVQRALELTGCAGVADMAAQLIAARATIADLERKLDTARGDCLDTARSAYETLTQARRNVAAGSGHECDEWLDERQKCMLCDRQCTLPGHGAP